MKVLINTIGKKYTLVKENTRCCHKIRQECGFTQKVSFFSIALCFLPHCHANIGRQVRLIPPNTYQEIYDAHTCLNFWKNMSKCVFLEDMLKSRCKFITLLEKYEQQKQPHDRCGGDFATKKSSEVNPVCRSIASSARFACHVPNRRSGWM